MTKANPRCNCTFCKLRRPYEHATCIAFKDFVMTDLSCPQCSHRQSRSSRHLEEPKWVRLCMNCLHVYERKDSGADAV